MLAHRQCGRHAGESGDHLSFGALLNLPFHEPGEGTFVELLSAVGERRDRGRCFAL